MSKPQVIEANAVSFSRRLEYNDHLINHKVSIIPIGIISGQPKTRFMWEWSTDYGKGFNVKNTAHSLNEMRVQLIEHYRFKSILKSKYRQDYECFVSKNWIPFCFNLIKSINTKNHFFVNFLDELSSYDEDNIRFQVAQCKYTPINVIEKLCQDPITEIKIAAIFYKNYNSINKQPIPQSMNMFEFDDWVHNASIEELDEFSNSVFENKKKTLIERLFR